MTLSIARVRHYLREFMLEKLFIDELGWDRHAAQLSVQMDGQTYTLNTMAEKRGVQVFQCQPDVQGNIPDYASRRKIDKQVAKSAFEHLIIYIDAAKTMQIWQWVARQPGQPAAYREQHFHPPHQSGDALIQKLETITFLLSEEEGLDLTGVVFRLRDAFDRDQVTKRFYDHFKREHTAFLGFIQGITDQGDKEWYASLMLNRLMFVYFIQRKGFLDNDPDYLKNRLKLVQQRQGRGQFHTFYRYFLIRLFHEGFSQQPAQRARDLEDLLGDVPYLNGGLFELHTLEEKHTDIEIPDEAFKHLFGFFDQYDWHLDTRSLSSGREINPDVLGYIFEKYINQKQMGAYYSKEDITEYISKSTIIPDLFDAAQKTCAIAFQPNSTLWQLLRDDPDRYIYAPVRKGVDLPLPEDIARGIEDIGQRGGWNRPAAPAFALPTETWREYVSRRQRCLEVRDKLQAGEIHQIHDLIPYNLDVRQFAEDVVSTCEGPQLLRAFYQAIPTVTVLDPACGSGAFLFAALKILELLYEACLDRMQAFVDDLERSGERHHPSKFSDFRRILAEGERHPNRRYFILKSIIVNNLYGVDIMEEAVEICKLRLFLKLVAQVDRVKDLEPLPDIDFNIRPGNTLVGFLSIDEIRRAAERDAAGQGRLVYSEIEEDIRRIGEDAEIVDRAFRKFHEMQGGLGMNAREFAAAKQDLRGRLRTLAAELDRYLAGEYGVDPGKTEAYNQWRESHQPFHWIAEFYGTMRRGGFDVIIGNPPYLEKSKIGGHYSVKGLRTLPCRDIYAWMVERAFSLRNGTGRLGLIIPVSVASSRSFDVLRDVISAKSTLLWMAHFANRPSQLFVGAQNRLTILLSGTQGSGTQAFSTCYHRWDGPRGGRDFLFHVIRYVPLGDLSRLFHGLYPKIGDPKAATILRKISNSYTISEFTMRKSVHAIYWVRVPGYFCQFFVDPPKARPEKGGTSRIRGEVNAICLPDPTSMRVTHALLNSSTYYQFFTAYTDGRHINPSDVIDFPFDLNQIADPIRNSLNMLSKNLEDAMLENTGLWRKCGLLIESVDSRPTKPVIDEIDHVLSQHYGLRDEELDFLINYDIKYRMGRDEWDDGE